MRFFKVLFLIIGLSLLLIACGSDSGSDCCSDSGNVSGYWVVYHTDTGGTEEGPSYWTLSQSGNNITGSWLCGDSETITGSVDRSNITISWTSSEGQITSLTGTFNGNTVSGTYEGGTWRAEKRTTEPQCVLSVDVATQYFYPNRYHLGITLKNVDTSTISSVDVSGPNITSVWQYLSDHYVANLSAQPTIGDTYNIRVTYTDNTNEDNQYIVDGINSNLALIISPADGSTITTTTPTFIWQEASNIMTYSLRIHIEGGDRTWNKSFNVGTNSAVYNSDDTASALLQSGQTYRIYLHTFDSNGNQATTESTFTIQ
jgi:hypothetical protein